MNNFENTNNYLECFNLITDEMANNMLTTQFENNITIYFIQCMIPHHQAAIYMCQNLLKYTTFKPLQDIANNIIVMQTKGISEMCCVLNNTKIYFNSNSDIMNYVYNYFIITNNMVNEMRKSPRYLDIDLDFICEMIPHHQAAIRMCYNLINYNINPNLRTIAINIIKEQTRGVEQLEKLKHFLLEKKYCQ